MTDRPLSERIRDLMGWFDPEFAPQAQVVNGLANEVRRLESAAPDLAQTIAGMTEEWGVRFPDGSEWWPEGDSDEIVHAANLDPAARFVRRLVGPVEVIDGE